MKKILLVFFSFVFLMLMLSSCSAATYGSGPYGAGAYGIGYTAAGAPSGGGGGGGGGTVYLYKGWEVIFEFEGRNYTISLEDIVNNVAVIEVSGANKNWNFNLGVNQTQKIDLNDDRVYDLSVSLDSIIGNQVHLSARAIQEGFGGNISNITGGGEIKPTELIGEEQLRFIRIFLAACIIALVLTIILLRRKYARVAKSESKPLLEKINGLT